MSKSYEFQGKNVDQALEKASDELSIPAEKIKHEVMAYGSSGIFGLVGVKKAKIKVFVEEDKNKAKRLKPYQKKSTVEKFEKTLPIKGTLESEGSPKHDEELLSSGIQGLQTLINGITVGATVQLVQKKDKLIFSISGGDSGVLIGKRGQTLEAIQYLLEKMINKKSTNRVRVLVDVEGYLDKRKNNLEQMASRMAEKAKRTKKPVTIGQMNAHDRRIVHIYLKDENGVRTQSIGDGYYRKLMIFPKKQFGSNRRNTDAKA
ncbi:RNA-binding cell elongation regulator Jag/EloR [uncultured Desulfosarcina sp.]|uniref:RNA-binding cell elongation regulator Jag/EloR n=1 Tax=uncultured Desulfosarcina sp. TaxID=218289 RepID=UPI0029C7BBDF|nr:RNA-binding cell elongation regulator Jag/EloR [uncultured Desulfosarcina sp.]